MIKPALALILLLLSGVSAAADLTAMETRWLTAALPVIAYAKQLTLPLDIVVQPVAQANDVPMALGFEHGRCKLVLSMRGNADAENILASLPSGQRSLMIEAMAAHEIGHCWRYVQGMWHVLPSGFMNLGGARAVSPDLLAAARELRETRREEGYADLVALAWIQQRHPGQYGEVAGWLRQVRQPNPAESGISSHDTQAWLQLAPYGVVF